MLVAHDPLSEATTRQPLTINTFEKGNKDFFKGFEQEQRFFFISGILAALLVIALCNPGWREKIWVNDSRNPR
jgi:hypothetical protein